MKQTMQTMPKILSLFGIVVLLLSANMQLTARGSGKGNNTLTIASKNYTENIVLAHIMAEWIRAQSDIQVALKANLGGTLIVWQAMKQREIDIFPDFDGTMYQHVLKKEAKLSDDEVLRIVRREIMEQYRVKVLEPFGFQNNYAIGMLRTRAEELGITKISDLENHLDLIAGFDSEFIARDVDGSAPMFATYGFTPNNPVVQLETGLKYTAITEGLADYTIAYTTDAKLKRFDLKMLQDDKSFFPVYNGVPVAHQQALERFPELEGILLSLGGKIDDGEMTAMNYDVEENKMEPKEVALKFLKAKGLIQ